MGNERHTLDEAAAQLGVSRRTLERAKAKGAPGFSKIAGAVYVDLEEYKAWKSGGSSKAKSPKNFCPEPSTTSDITAVGLSGPTKISYSDARTRKEIALAKKHELDLELKRGDYIHRDELLEMMAKIGGTLKGKLLAQPSRLCGRFADIVEPRELQMEWDKEQWDLLESLSKDFGVIIEG